jgi:hypothetical protein
MFPQYVVLHTHKFGVSTYLVQSDCFPTERQVVRCLGLDFEPHKEETIEIQLVDATETITLNWIESDALEFGEAE